MGKTRPFSNINVNRDRDIVMYYAVNSCHLFLNVWSSYIIFIRLTDMYVFYHNGNI